MTGKNMAATKKSRKNYLKNKPFRRTVSVILSMLLLLNLMGCGGAEGLQTQENTDESIKIGLTFDSLIIERWEKDRDVFVSRARELGAEVNVQNANGDVDAQIAHIEYFIEKKVDAIVVVATDCDALKESVAKAKKAGIKVISYDRLISNSDTDLYISFDNEKVGELMGAAIISQIGRTGDILMVNGPLTDTNVPVVMSGFNNALRLSRINIVETYYAEGWRPEYAFDYVSRYLSTNPDNPPLAIMCGNDSLAGQVIKALSERKLAGTVTVTGQDGDLDACQRVVEGTQYMTVYKPVEKLAQRAAELTVELITRGEIEVEGSINDGTYDIPYESLEPIAVTAENMDEVIIGTCHQKSEVYLNVEPPSENE